MKMKFYVLLIVLSVMVLAFSCKREIAKQINKKIQFNDSIKLSLDSTIQKKEIRNPHEYRYVVASSGLNYRDEPNGNILGKFVWRDKVEYLFDSKCSQKIIDQYREINGTWIAVKRGQDTVYVFSHYLSLHKPRFSNIKLYYADPYYKLILKPSNKIDIKQAFVNVSESFDIPKNFITQNDLRKDTIYFTQNQRIEFLKRMNYSNRDTIFIYNVASGFVKKYPIKNTPLIACINIYSKVRDEYKNEDYNPWEYQIGFDLGKSPDGGLTAIGAENPFIERGLQPLVFEEMNQEMIESCIKNKLIPEDWKNDSIYKPFISKYKNIYSFVKMEKGLNAWSDLLVKNIETKDSYYIYQTEGESSNKAPLRVKEEKSKDRGNYQYIGKLFKNKPPVAFGFLWESFGCPQIHFLDTEELPILILCDNRH